MLNDICDVPGINHFSKAVQWSFRDEYLHYTFNKYLIKKFKIKADETILPVEACKALEREYRIIDYVYSSDEVSCDRYKSLMKELCGIRLAEACGATPIEPSLTLQTAISRFDTPLTTNRFESVNHAYRKGE
jgi:hypothetical protein